MFERLKKRNNPQPTDRIFPKSHHAMFNQILVELGLKFDREGRPRTLYSLRHTYICFRLMEGADIYMLAKNCRTSVEMIEKYYAAHVNGAGVQHVLKVGRGRKWRKSAAESWRHCGKPHQWAPTSRNDHRHRQGGDESGWATSTPGASAPC